MRRFTYLANDLGLGNAGVQVIDVPIQEPITALWLEMRCANGAGHNDYSPMHFCVNSIDIIDGSNVLWSVDGTQLLGLVCGQLGYMPHQRFSALGGDPQTLALPILFGNYLGDTERAFDPRKFTNPQVRVSWNLANVNAVGANGYATGGLTMTLIAEIMESGVSPRALLTGKEVFTYTSAVGTQFIDMPRDHPYKALMIQPVATTSHWWDVITRIRLNLDGAKLVPIDMVGEDMQYMLAMRQPRLSYRESAHPVNGGTLQLWLKEVEDVSLNIEENRSLTYAYENFEYGQQTIRIWAADAAHLPHVNVGTHVHGYCPFHCVYIPFGDGMKPDEWFQAPNYGSVRLELTAAIARAVSIVALQEEPY